MKNWKRDISKRNSLGMPQIKIFVEGVIPEQSGMIANVFGRTLEKCEERAKLITSAPELLENLARIIERIEENGFQTAFPSAYERAKTAIKKAVE